MRLNLSSQIVLNKVPVEFYKDYRLFPRGSCFTFTQYNCMAGCKAAQADRKCMERHKGECCTSAGACGSVCGDNRNCTLVSGELYERNRRSTF